MSMWAKVYTVNGRAAKHVRERTAAPSHADSRKAWGTVCWERGSAEGGRGVNWFGPWEPFAHPDRFHCVGTWLSLVEHSLGVRGVGSSNLPVPTIKIN
jgi:hypothetical protein